MTDLETLKALYEEDGIWAIEEDEQVKVIDAGKWVSEGKYEYKTTIVELDGKYYSIDENRSGSYFSDYHYGDVTIEQVLREEKTVIQVSWVGTGNKIDIEEKY